MKATSLRVTEEAEEMHLRLVFESSQDRYGSILAHGRDG